MIMALSHHLSSKWFDDLNGTAKYWVHNELSLNVSDL